MAKINPPFFPIIYVRGYARTQDEIDATVATPYMGFNLGATKIRQDWRGKVDRHIFESPLIRLMKDYQYRDIYEAGRVKSGELPARSVIIHRYYDPADSDFGGADAPSILVAANGLSELILKVREQVCGNDTVARQAFKVYLVAHSMGGLICRCLLQNDSVGAAEAKNLVEKVFTYATPHNGIEMAGVNVPRFLGIWDLNNFNRHRMAEFLGLPGKPDRVNSLNERFDPDRFFSLVGTNHKDYTVAGGWSSRLAGEMSDGLVRIENATVRGSPRAFVYRSHSGPYGIVNSEEGYQNLARFLFGDVRLDAVLEVEELPLPPSVRRAKDKEDEEIRASYYFEATVVPRVSKNFSFKLTERRKETHSAVLRKFDEMLRIESIPDLDKPRWPVLCSAFLNSRQVMRGRTIVVNLDLAVSTTGYEIDGVLFFDKHIDGEYLYRESITIRLTPSEDAWNIRYNPDSESWAESRGRAIETDNRGKYIPLSNKKGFSAKLRIKSSSL